MDHDRIRKLRDDALEARARGSLRAAATAYRELEELDPADPLWPKSLAECLDADRDLEGYVAALERAAALYAERGFVVRAISVHKMILRRSPEHQRALDTLVELQAQRVTGIARIRRRPPTAPPPSPPTQGVVELRNVDPPERVVPALEGNERDALISAPMFARLSPTSLRHVITAVQLVELGASETLYHRGAAPDSMYVIVDGRVALSAGSSGASTIAELGPGDVLGVVGLCAGEPRPIGAITLEPTRLLQLPSASLDALYREAPELREALLDLALDRLLSVLLATHPLFARFQTTSHDELARRFRLFEIEEGVRLVEVGRVSNHLFVVMTGQLDVIGPDGGVVAALGAGNLAGETGFLSRTPPAMPIVARRKSLVLGLAYEDFIALASQFPSFLDGVVREAHAPVWDPARIS